MRKAWGIALPQDFERVAGEAREKEREDDGAFVMSNEFIM